METLTCGCKPPKSEQVSSEDLMPLRKASDWPTLHDCKRTATGREHHDRLVEDAFLAGIAGQRTVLPIDMGAGCP